jgi:hypothetical protein
MEIRAEPDHKFNRRNLFLCAFGVGLAIWATYDINFRYPAKIEKAQIYEEILEKSKNEEDAKVKWASLAEEKGWSLKPPEHTAEYEQRNIFYNYLMVVGGIFIAAYFLWKWFRVRSSWFGADETHIKSSFGTNVPFDSIQSVDKTRWEKKGIAQVKYTDDKGGEAILIMDDFKYVREPMGEIMQRITERLKPGQIIDKKEQKTSTQKKSQPTKKTAEEKSNS